MTHTKTIDIILRVGVAFALLYPAVNALGDPNSWIGYFPSFMFGVVDDLVLLHAFGALEVVLAIWILSGWRVWVPASITTALLLGIVAFNIPQFQVLFRDVSIAAAALALALIHYPRHTSGTDS